MSHFIISSGSMCTFGTPNGHASTQFEQAMQRGFSALRTTPSSPFLIASAGQTSAQVGSSQCMQTIGTVAIVFGRSMKSTWIIETPRWVSHSAQAATQDAAADAARRVDVELVAEHQTPFPRGSRHLRGPSGFLHAEVSSRSAARDAFSMRQAETLYSGILLRGSSVRCVSRLALRRPGQ